MFFSIVFACAYEKEGNRYPFGYKGQLPWQRIRQDMNSFAQITKNGVLIMGRKTYDSLPIFKGEFRGRPCVCVSSSSSSHKTLDAALVYANVTWPDKPLFVIGGASLLDEAIRHSSCLTVYHTRVYGSNPFEADCFVNASTITDMEKGFALEKSETVLINSKDVQSIDLTVWKRR